MRAVQQDAEIAQGWNKAAVRGSSGKQAAEQGDQQDRSETRRRITLELLANKRGELSAHRDRNPA
jgi:hypothetical protein